jgi:hypothetical protein
MTCVVSRGGGERALWLPLNRAWSTRDAHRHRRSARQNTNDWKTRKECQPTSHPTPKRPQTIKACQQDKYAYRDVQQTSLTRLSGATKPKRVRNASGERIEALQQCDEQRKGRANEPSLTARARVGSIIDGPLPTRLPTEPERTPISAIADANASALVGFGMCCSK